MANTPQTGRLTTLWYSRTKTGEKTQIANVQGIPSMREPRETVTYDALDYESERQAKGGRKASTRNINVLYTEQQHKTLRGISDSDENYFFFIKYADSTKDQEDGALVMTFEAQIDLSNDEIPAGDEMYQDVLTFYVSSEVTESYGFPTE